MGPLPKHRVLSEAELETLKTLWETGPAPASAVLERMNAGGRNWAYTTARTVLSRLEQKGYVTRDVRAVPHVYAPKYSAGAIARERLGRIRRDLFGGAGLPLVRALVDDAALTHAEIVELRALLAERQGAEDRPE